MKTLALVFVITASLAHAAPTLDANGVLIDAHGDMVTASQDDAKTMCPSGTHLPTIRDFAQEALGIGAQTMPAKRAWDWYFIHGPPENIPGYYLVMYFTPDGSGNYGDEDDFYYGRMNYPGPNGIGAKYMQFWSSSIYTIDNGYGFTFDNTGNVNIEGGSTAAAIRCIQDDGKFIGAQPQD